MKKILFVLLAVVINGMMLSCSSPLEEEEKEAMEENNEVENNENQEKVVYMLPKTTPVNLSAEQKVFAADNNGFTLNFLKVMNEADVSGKGFVSSPLSIIYILAMVNDAAIGDTEQELEHTLGFHTGGIQAVNNYCKSLIDNLPNVDENVQLTVANAIFVNNRYSLKRQFQNDMQTYYDAKAEILDFSSPSTLNYINGWCNEKTRSMIPTILDDISPDAVSYLLNAVYFKANWTSKFDPKKTKMETFATIKGSKQIPLMHQKVVTGYVITDAYAAVTLPYGSGQWNMAVLLPEEGKTTDDVINMMAVDGWLTDAGKNPLLSYDIGVIDLKLPRFETSSDTNETKGKLIGLLKKMGIQQAFDQNLAEIPNMCDRPVFISDMRQKAKIEVDEEGSKMAAVTEAGMFTTAFIGDDDESSQVLHANFHANRPFVYLVYEASSGVILFVGKYTGE